MSAGDIDSKYNVTDLATKGRVSNTLVVADGGTLVATTSGFGVEQVSSISKYKVDGTLDGSYGNKGLLNLAAGQEIRTIKEVSDGTLVFLANYEGTKAEIIKLKSSGLIDTSFKSISPAAVNFIAKSDGTILGLDTTGNLLTYSADGVLKSTAPLFQGARSTTFTLDEKILAVYPSPNGSSIVPVKRFNLDGSLDTSFSKDASKSLATEIIAAKNGEFYEYTSGYVNGPPSELIKHSANGLVDKTFGINGSLDLSTFRNPGFESLKFGVFLAPDGKILIKGFTPDPSLAKYNSNGTLDKTFGDNGIRVLQGNLVDVEASTIAFQENGDIVSADGGLLAQYQGAGSTPIANNRVGTNSADGIAGGSGDDVIFGRDGNDRLFGSTGNDSIDGENGNDTIFGGKGNDFLYGANGNDSLSGDFGNDFLNGGYDNDILVGGDGADTLLGELGDDSLYGGNDNDRLLGGTGNDYLNGGYGGDTIVGDDGADNIFGDRGNDFLYGGNGNDYLFGGDDNDSINGGYGDDYLIGNNGSDTLFGDVGNDYLHGYEGDDKLFGGDGNDILEDSTGANVLSGGNGNDILYSGSTNTLTGGAGNDTFGGFYAGTATISDFQAGTDKISLNKAAFSALQSLKGDAFSIANEFAVVNNSSAVDSSKALIVYNTQTGNLTYNIDREVVGIGNRDEFAKLQGTPNLAASDFVIT
jgi:Ca2+-binding RTX toxin-like protein